MTKKPKGYWTDKNTIIEMQPIIDKIGHFPTQPELRKMGYNSLEHSIHRNGGTNKFRQLMGYLPVQKPIGFWTDEVITQKLKIIISQIGDFPTHTELNKNGYGDLSSAMRKNGNTTNKFRELLGFQKYREPITSWTDERIITELTEIINRIGYSPTSSELIDMNKMSLSLAIHRNGGMVKFRQILNQPILHYPEGYWSDEKIIEELNRIISEIGHFPSQLEIVKTGNGRINPAINKNGGINKFRELLGYNISLYEKHRALLASYTNKRGKKSEKFVKQIITEWSNTHNKLSPSYNKKLSKGNVIEFVCDTGKRIGIDVTNTKLREAVYRKWTRKDYHKYLDELWIVVFSDIFTFTDYHKWNQNSPENVKVMSIYQFLEELDYSLNDQIKDKICKLESCTFHTKAQFKKIIIPTPSNNVFII